jgi:hypothetical protein
MGGRVLLEKVAPEVNVRQSAASIDGDIVTLDD